MSEFFKNVSEGQNWKPEPYQRYNAVNALLSQFGATGTGHAARSIADRTVFTAVNRDEKAFQEGIAVEALSAEMEDGELVPVKTSGTGTAALWGVALASLEPGDIGPVLLSGVAAVRLSAALPAGTKFVEPGDGGSFKAASGGRAQVIASQGNTALVLLGGAGAEEERISFQISAVTREETGEDGRKKTSVSIVVQDGLDNGSEYAGTVRLGDGTLQPVPRFETSNSETPKYLYLVMDVTHDPPVYILEHESAELKSVLGGLVLIGSYSLRENAAVIKQNLRQTVPVELGPAYLGPYCVLPGPPNTGDGYTFVLNPAQGLTLANGGYYVNGITSGAGEVVEPKIFKVRQSSIRLWAALKAPRYEIGAEAPTVPGSLTILNAEPSSSAYDAVMEITGNSSGVLNIWWTSSTTDTIAGLLFKNQMDV